MIWYRWKWWIFAWSCNRGGSATAHGYRWSSVFGSRLYIRTQKIEATRPVLGLYPRKLWLEDRLMSIDQAIERRRQAERHIPVAWTEEFKLIDRELSCLEEREANDEA
jgi:hypothetical protein